MSNVSHGQQLDGEVVCGGEGELDGLACFALLCLLCMAFDLHNGGYSQIYLALNLFVWIRIKPW